MGSGFELIQIAFDRAGAAVQNKDLHFFPRPHFQLRISGISCAVLVYIFLMFEKFVPQKLLYISGASVQLRDAIDHIADEMEQRSRSFMTTMSKGVVVVPSSLYPLTCM